MKPNILFIIDDNSDIDRWIYLEAPEDVNISIMRKRQVYNCESINGYDQVIVAIGSVRLYTMHTLSYPKNWLELKVVLDDSPRLFVSDTPLGYFLESLIKE